MDLLAIKYVTTLFAFVLILMIVVVTNYSSKRLKGLCRLKRWAEKTVAPNSSIIHGISSLLNISYSQCTKASLSILAVVYLQSKPGVKSIQVTYYIWRLTIHTPALRYSCNHSLFDYCHAPTIVFVTVSFPALPGYIIYAALVSFSDRTMHCQA